MHLNYPAFLSITRVLLLGFLSLCLNPVKAQNQSIADSLTTIYESGDLSPEDSLTTLWELIKNLTDPNEKLSNSEILIQLAEAQGNYLFVTKGYTGKGTALRLLGDIPEALQSFFKASEYAIQHNIGDQLGLIYVNIGDTYSVIGNHSLAINYYNKGIPLLRGHADNRLFASALYNLGDTYYLSGNLDSALYFFEEARPYFVELNHQIGLAYTIGNIGQVQTQQGQYDEAEINLNQAIEILTPLGDYYSISAYLIPLSDVYLAQNRNKEALEAAQKSLQLAEDYGLKEQIRDASMKLSNIYEKLGEHQKSMSYLKTHNIYKDSINNLAVVQEMAEMRTEFEVAQKQSEVDLLTKEAEIADLRERRQRWVLIGTVLSLILVVVLAIGAYRRVRYVQRTKKIIEEERNRSEDLLLNILPEETALELKLKGNVQARRVEAVTVLFTDFIGFTSYAERVSPEQMVRSIDFYFRKFDEIITKYKLEKIKTIGDSYMCAGGLHSETSEAWQVARAALEMIEVTESAKYSEDDIVHFDMRIGIHTGPVVAGIVGTKKWQYDIWGDTVNVASGMEANSMSERINISETTNEIIQNDFETEFRGELEVKNRGSLKMYFLNKEKVKEANLA